MDLKKIKLVVQPDKHGCVIASISMITNIDYYELVNKYIRHDLNDIGYNTPGQNKILKDLGYKTCVIKYLPKSYNTICILTVKSLNYPNSWHAIVYIIDHNGISHVLDPNDGYVSEKRIIYTTNLVLNIESKNLYDCTIITK